MFTGIITAIGKVEALQAQGGDILLKVNSQDLDLSDVKLGDSIATVSYTHLTLPTIYSV